MTPLQEPALEARCMAEDVTCTRMLPNGLTLTVLDGVTLCVRPGKLLCVTGRSGSGKTTLLSILSGLLRPTDGRVYWGAEEIWSLSEPERAARRRERIAVILQDGGLIEWLTAEENIALSLADDAADRRERVHDVLERVGLGDRRTNYPHQLSMGERERVAIARALIRSPEVVIVDEPTAALDRVTSTSVLELLLRLARATGAGLIVASHDPYVIELADSNFHLEG